MPRGSSDTLYSREHRHCTEKDLEPGESCPGHLFAAAGGSIVEYLRSMTFAEEVYIAHPPERHCAGAPQLKAKKRDYMQRTYVFGISYGCMCMCGLNTLYTPHRTHRYKKILHPPALSEAEAAKLCSTSSSRFHRGQAIIPVHTHELGLGFDTESRTLRSAQGSRHTGTPKTTKNAQNRSVQPATTTHRSENPTMKP